MIAMSLFADTFPQCPAVVARSPRLPDDLNDFLFINPRGAPEWTSDPAAAMTFESMREAMRMAMRLPASVRAFSLPLTSDLVGRRDLH